MNHPAVSHPSSGHPQPAPHGRDHESPPVRRDLAADDHIDHDRTPTARLAVVGNRVVRSMDSDADDATDGAAVSQADSDAVSQAVSDAFSQAATHEDRRDAPGPATVTDELFGETYAAALSRRRQRRRQRIADTEAIDNPRLIIGDDGDAHLSDTVGHALRDDLRKTPAANRDAAAASCNRDCAPILAVLILCACITLIALAIIALAEFPR